MLGCKCLELVSVPPHGWVSEGIRVGGKESSMFSFRRAVATLGFIWLVSSGVAALGQDSGSSQPTQEQTPAPQAPAATQNQGQVSVQGRIRARREARRLQAIRDTYAQRYELFIGSGYQRFT